ncbi:BppU family phage baseplate upper protein [Staphylococcus aureus]|uniref:BppU family phage baseplate upper protein n=1 Tax=Staphylococcus aureus TaxID=1280 RepID=UPI0013F5CBFD|nr:BppU family phage baseplate upper protein [Staphylococcus aureus]NHC98394.1 phage baseplate upper protein [Staphylococcus aureus]NHE14283.1 phage baseplate upper protein [Staphylococcus aureus]
MAMDKIGNINLETSANYQSLSDLNIQFWNQDKNTAVLQFKITRNDFPLSLSKENVEVFIKLESGANYIVDSTEVIDGGFEIIDELNGIVSYTIPTEFMTVAQSVTGQVYVATKDREEVVVQRKFSFEVAEDLLSTIPASEKLKEIKLFAQLRDEVSDTMAKLNEDFANMQDYVSMVNQAATDGVNQLNTLSEDKLSEYNSNHTEKLNTMTTTGDNYTTQFVEDKNYIDNKMTEFEQKVIGSDVVTQGEAQNWQKYKLTDDSGVLPIVNLRGDLEALQALPSGFYYRSFVPITGVGQTSSTGFVTVWESNDGQVKHISFKPYNSSQEFIMRYYNGWSGWENKFDGLEKSIDAQAKANTAESNAKVYTDEKVFNLHTTLFEGSANGVGSTIPLTETLDNFIFLYIYGKFDGGYFAETGDPSESNDIVIDRTNVIGTDGAYATVFECIIQKVNRTQLKTTSDTYHGVNSGNGSGADANRFTINKIIGVRKYADIAQPE